MDAIAATWCQAGRHPMRGVAALLRSPLPGPLPSPPANCSEGGDRIDLPSDTGGDLFISCVFLCYLRAQWSYYDAARRALHACTARCAAPCVTVISSSSSSNCSTEVTSLDSPWDCNPFADWAGRE
jgi:hypothetical protein